ncbi:hypothetical protein Tco_1572071 [Tanacetum coccineum]
MIEDYDFYNCVESVPCKSKAASVPAGSRNSPASVTAGGSDPAASRNRPAVNSADRPNPAGWSKRPATVSAGRPVSAGWLNPAASRNRPAVNSADRPNPAGWSKRPATVSASRPVSASWLNPSARPYFRLSSVYFNNMYWPDLYDPMYGVDESQDKYFWLNPEVDVGLELWRDVNMLCSLHSDDVEDFWRTQDEWIVSSWKLYPKSSVHVLDLTNGKTVYMFVDKFYPIRATLLERMLCHRLTVPPSYCRDVVVAENIISI